MLYRGPRADVVHPTVDGYSLLAEQVFDRLVSEGWISAGRADS